MRGEERQTVVDLHKIEGVGNKRQREEERVNERREEERRRDRADHALGRRTDRKVRGDRGMKS